MNKLFKYIITGIGALLSLSACSLMPFDFNNGNIPNREEIANNFQINFDYTYRELPAQSNQINYFYVTNRNSERVAIDNAYVEPSSDCDYSVFQNDNYVWGLEFASHRQEKIIFYVTAYVKNSIEVKGSFTVNFTNPIANYVVDSDIPEETIIAPLDYDTRYFIYLRNRNGNPVHIKDIELVLESGGVNFWWDDFGDHAEIVFNPHSFCDSNINIYLYDELDNKITVERKLIADRFEVSTNIPSSLTFGEPNNYLISLRGQYTGVYQPINRVIIHSQNDLIYYQEFYCGGENDVQINLPIQKPGQDILTIRIYDQRDIEYYYEKSVQIIESIDLFYEEYRNFPGFESMRINNSYEFVLSIRGSYSGNSYNIGNVSMSCTSGALTYGWEPLTSTTALISIQTSGQTTQGRFGITLTTYDLPNGSNVATEFYTFVISQ